jgi:hypothetical protein
MVLAAVAGDFREKGSGRWEITFLEVVLRFQLFPRGR